LTLKKKSIAHLLHHFHFHLRFRRYYYYCCCGNCDVDNGADDDYCSEVDKVGVLYYIVGVVIIERGCAR
jgi:hypothetical protein